MPDFSSISIPPPKDWQAFERSCCVLFECILGDPNTQLHGRTGQSQNGVDIYGRRGGEGGPWVGVQCKGKEASTFNKKVTERELRSEVKKAFNFQPKLQEFILATTAPNDVVIQRVARAITDENIIANNPMTVEVWGWDELEKRIAEHPRALKAFHPDLTPFTDDILSGQSEISHWVESGFEKTFKQLNEIKSTLGSFIDNTTKSSPKDQSELEAQLHHDIDTYRDLILDGQPKTGKLLLEKLKERIWKKASSRIKFRIITNIGAALLKLGDENEASDTFLTAISFDPFDRIGMANVSLAYLLKEDMGQAINSAKNALRKNPENEEAAGYLIQAHYSDKGISDPFDLIPENLKKKKSVMIGGIFFWRRRGSPRWIELTKEAIILFPESNEIKRLLAEAHLESIFVSKWVLLGDNAGEKDKINYLEKTTAILFSIWDNIKNGEDKIDVPLINNLVMALRLLEKHEDAANVLDEALLQFPDSPILIRLRAICYISLKQEEKALELLTQKKGDDPENIILTAELLLKEDPVKAREVVSEINDNEIPEEFNIQAWTIQIESFLREKNCDLAITFARSLVLKYPDSVDCLITLSNALRDCGDESSEEFLLKAKSLINENSSFLDRFLIAKELNKWSYFDEAVEVLENRIDFERDTPALRLFLSSLMDSNKRRKTYEYLKKIPSEIRKKPWFLKTQISVQIARGDYPKAINLIDDYLKIYPNDLSIRLTWISLCSRSKDGSIKIRKFLEENVEVLEGDAVDRIQLALLLAKYNFEERALRLGYYTLTENLDLPEIQLKYIALLLYPNRFKNIDINPNEVGEDSVFQIDSERGESDYFIIERDANLRKDNHSISPEHPIARKVLGLHINESFILDETITPPDIWHIKLIRHKYLYVLHECMDRFNRQFPTFQGFHKIHFDPNAPENLLNIVKARHDFIRELLENYEKNPIPISVLSSLLSIDVIKTFQGILETKRPFRVCVGTAEERTMAFDSIKRNNKNGCIIDPLTFYIIRRLGIENLIENLCGKIGMTESSIDIFRARLEELELHGDKPFLALSYKNGQYLKEEITTERMFIGLAEAKDDLNWIEENCDILTIEKDIEDHILFKDIPNYPERGLFDTILVAEGSNRILICEDFYYRLLSTQDKNDSATWLQPILIVARDQEMLAPEKYDELLFYMLDSNFKYISVDSESLCRVANYKTDLEGKKFNKFAEAIGGASAEIRSHLGVVISFIREMWKEYDPPLKNKAQTSKILECLLRGRANDHREIILALFQISASEQFRRYLLRWLKGHFYLTI
jgi:tetratricopeptide (TPR) repeat protein